MKVAVFGTTVSESFLPYLTDFFGLLKQFKVQVQIFKPFYDFLYQERNLSVYHNSFFQSPIDFDDSNKFIFCIGGDGTFLHSMVNIRNFEIPVVGVNSGRLGFLADISQEQIHDALTDIFTNRYTIIERSLLEVEFSGKESIDFSFALNELAVLKTDSSSMINVTAWCDNQLLNNYWADGLIIATPTGSTAYSLSVGGPIITSDSKNFVITPLAPHNLTVRPIVVPDNYTIKLKVDGRGNNYRVSLDYRSVTVDFSSFLTIRKANVTLKTLQLPDRTFFNTLRNKLLWGFDKRN